MENGTHGKEEPSCTQRESSQAAVPWRLQNRLARAKPHEQLAMVRTHASPAATTNCVVTYACTKGAHSHIEGLSGLEFCSLPPGTHKTIAKTWQGFHGSMRTLALLNLSLASPGNAMTKSLAGGCCLVSAIYLLCESRETT